MDQIDVLHITHTTPLKDSRIMREIRALERSGLFRVSVFGFASSEEATAGFETVEFAPDHSFRVWQFYFSRRRITLTIRFRARLPLMAIERFLNVLLARAHITRTFRLRYSLLRVLSYLRKPFQLFSVFLPFFSSNIVSRLADEPVEIVHCHDWVSLPLAARVAIVKKARLVYDSHELATEMNGYSWGRKKLVYYVERFHWGQVDLFISVSDMIINHYLEKYGTKEFRVIHNTPESGPDGRFPDRSETIRDHVPVGKNKIVAVYVGSLTFGRGLDTIVSAVRLNPPDIHFSFLGQGPQEQELRDATSGHKNVSFMDPVAGDQVVPFLRGADVGLCLIEPTCLSYQYSLPNKLFESLFSGAKVVATNLPEISRLVESVGGGLLIGGNDPEELIEAIREAHKLPRTDYKALEKYGWPTVSAELVAGYRTLLPA